MASAVAVRAATAMATLETKGPRPDSSSGPVAQGGIGAGEHPEAVRSWPRGSAKQLMHVLVPAHL